MRLAVVFAAALGLAVGCTGTEGTLLLRHGAAGAGGAGSEDDRYVPAATARWFAQLDGPVDLERPVDFFYLDPEQQEAGALAALRERGGHYVCYLSAGTLENFRADVDAFPEAAIGEPLRGFPNERWLNVRDPLVRELMGARIAALAEAGCDSLMPASLSGYAAETGFELSLAESLDYARWLAEQSHAAGMSIGLTAPAAMTSELWSGFDFGLAIACVAGTACSEYGVFGAANKPVLHVELGDEQSAPELCKAAQSLGFEALISDPGFTGQCLACREIL